MDNDFLDLQNSRSADNIIAQVMHKKHFIKLRYKFNKRTPYWIEIPVTPFNEHLVVGDIVNLQLKMLRIKT